MTKLSFVVVLISCLQASARSYGQVISLSAKDAGLGTVMRQIKIQTGYSFFYNESWLAQAKSVTVEAKNIPVRKALDLVFKGQPFTYEIVNHTIVLKLKAKALSSDKTLPKDTAITVQGKVTDDKGTPLPGVIVRLKGSQIATATKAEGEFTIRTPGGPDTLVFSFVGYNSREVSVSDQTNISVRLAPKSSSLNEVVVVSYGTQKKSDVTGSISQLNADKLKDMPVGQFAQQLQGQIAGVNANINTGRPGQGIEIQIRGAVSINAGNYPLIVVDGQPLAAVQGLNPINNINPDEIESFTVLKDASATALYGSRASNGVILITTKHAKAGKTQLNFDAYYGLAALDKSHVPQMMNARQFATFMKEFFQDKIKYEKYINPVTQTATVPDDYADPSQYGKGTNWLNQVMRTAPTQSYNLSLSDSRKKSSTSIIAGYFNQQGIVINTGYQRYSIRANNEFRPFKFLKIGLNVAPSYQLDHNSQGARTDGSRNIVEGPLLSSPLISPYNTDGTPVNQASGFFLIPMPNYQLVAMNTNDVYKTSRILGNTYIEADILNGLTFKTSFNIDMSGTTHKRFINQYAGAYLGAPPPLPASSMSGLYATDNYISWVNENTLTYKTTFLNDHHIDALGGYTIQKYTEYSNSASGTDFPDASIPFISAAGITSGTSGFTEWTLLSLIGRLNYNYKETYLLSGAVRRDGSSKFGYDRQYGVFPSISAGWVVTNEPFMKNISVLNDLKFRASYGLTGNNNFNSGNYPAISLISPVNYVFNNVLTSGKYVSQLGNSELTWEKSKQFDFGIDVGMLNNRITVTYDYYHKITDGLLYQINIPQSSGFGSVSSNIGTFKFWGHEFTVNSVNLVGNLKWNTSFNITFNRNRIMKLGTQNLPILPPEAYDFPNIQKVGEPIGMFYGYVNDGVYLNQQQFDSEPKDVTSKVGSVRMKDVNEDGKITPDDRTIIGNPNPDFLYGMTNTFNYRQFDLNIVFQGSYGGQIEDLRAQSAANLDGAFNLYANQLDHWRSPEDPGNGKVPSTRAGTTALYRTVQSLWIHNGSYLTCKNISLGYTFNLRQNKYIKGLRVYGSVQQAFIITKYPGFDPELNSQGYYGLNGLNIGVDNTSYPVPRTFVIGVNMRLF